MKNKLILLGVLFLIFQFKIKACNLINAIDSIVIDLTNKKPQNKNIINLKRNSVFKLTIKYMSDYKIEVKRNNKKIEYTVPVYSINEMTQEVPIVFVESFQITSDAIEFSIKLTKKDYSAEDNDSFIYVFNVYASKYWTVMPTGGIARMKFENQKNYYYVANENPIGAAFKSDSLYTYSLFSKKQGWNTNMYIGSNFNYIFSNTASAGITSAIGYNLGAKTTPLNALLGANMSFGNKVKFTFGGGCSFMQIETIASEYLSQKIESKFSAPPTLPTKINQWSTGYYINFGITLANLID